MSLQERARREKLLKKAAGVVAACRKCVIGSLRTQSVYGEGDPCTPLMVVGEGPGETEDRLGRPFVGRAGDLLEKMLLAIELPREEIYICNTVKCRPTLDDGGRLKNRAPDRLELANCRPYLDDQIEIITPRVILALGAAAAKSFLGPEFAISKQRGQWFEGPNGIPLMVTFHPAYILRQTGGEMTAVKRMVWTDLKMVRAKLDEHAPAAGLPSAVEQASLFE